MIFLALPWKRTDMQPHKIWIEQCEVARGIEDEFGTDKALKYLVEEKFINFLEAAEDDPDFRAEIPTFVDGIKTIFEPFSTPRNGAKDSGLGLAIARRIIEAYDGTITVESRKDHGTTFEIKLAIESVH